MLRVIFTAAVVVALAGPAFAGLFPGVGTVQNQFSVTYSVFPDLFHKFSLYTMPRTTDEAKTLSFSQVSTRDEGNTTVWCRDKDYRVCVLFDVQGSVAGIQLSVSAREILNIKAPLDINSIPEWTPQRFMDLDIYSAIAYFVHEDIVRNGGRTLSVEDHTAPDGVFLVQSDKTGIETGRLHVSTEQKDAESAGFTEQSCFVGMGKHYFQNLKKDGVCEDHRPYFMLYGPKTQKLNGFGFVQYGKLDKLDRAWLESPPAIAAKMIAPNSPDCQKAWINQYGLFTMHVFFVARPYLTWC